MFVVSICFMGRATVNVQHQEEGSSVVVHMPNQNNWILNYEFHTKIPTKPILTLSVNVTVCQPCSYDRWYCRLGLDATALPCVTEAVYILRDRNFYKYMSTIAFDDSMRLQTLEYKLNVMVQWDTVHKDVPWFTNLMRRAMQD